MEEINHLKDMHRREVNINMDLKEMVCADVNGFQTIKIGSNGGIL
jgi:hypothetical protein